MPLAIPSLWSDDITVDVLPPHVILKSQAEAIKRITQGIVSAEVTTRVLPGGREAHHLELVVPALGNYLHRILTADHDQQEPYPVTIEARVFEPDDESNYDPDASDWRPTAATYQDFIARVKEVLQSPGVKSTVQSLIARSNAKKFVSQDVSEASSDTGGLPSASA